MLEVGEHPSRREDPTHLGERALHIGDRAEHQGGDNRIERPILEGQRLGPSVNGLHRYAALPPIEATLQVRPHRRERLNQRHVIRCGVMAHVGPRAGPDFGDPAGELPHQPSADRPEEGALDLGEHPVVTVGEPAGTPVLGQGRKAHLTTLSSARVEVFRRRHVKVEYLDPAGASGGRGCQVGLGRGGGSRRSSTRRSSSIEISRS